MNTRLFLIAALVVLLPSGCRRNTQMNLYVENVNAEKRLLEDKLYELQYDYEAKVEELARLRKQIDELQDGKSTGRDSGASNAPPARGGLFPGLGNLAPPAISPGTRSDGKSTPTKEKEKKKAASEEDDMLEPPKLDMGEEAEKSSAVPMPLDRTVTQLYLDPTSTGGHDADGQPGDDLLRVVLQPRNQNNDFVPEPGRVSVVLLDPTERTRVARWEFDVAQVRAAMRQSGSQNGIELKIPWKKAPPEKDRLHLFVRYWPSKGDPVEADREITIALPGGFATRWTPRSPRTPGARASISVAENPPENSGYSADQSKPADSDMGKRAAGGVPKQARLPQWRPYR